MQRCRRIIPRCAILLETAQEFQFQMDLLPFSLDDAAAVQTLAGNPAIAEMTLNIPHRIPAPPAGHRRLPPSVFFFSSVTLRPRPLSSLHSTSKATGIPASSLFVPFTMLS